MEMETATSEDLEFSQFKSHLSSSTLEKQPKPISIFMANRERTVLQAIRTLLCTDFIYHLLFTFILFIASTVVWSQAHLDSKPHPTFWHDVHANIKAVFRVEIPSFGILFTIRQFFDGLNAVMVDGVWVRGEDRGQVRLVAFILVLCNIVISTLYIFWPVLDNYDGQENTGGGKRRLCTSTDPANTSLGQTHSTRFGFQGDF